MIATIREYTFLGDHQSPKEGFIAALNQSILIPLLTLKDAVKWAHLLTRFAVVHQDLDGATLEEIYAKIPRP